MLTAIFGVAAMICAFGWFINRIVAKGLVLYMIEECGKAPIHGELEPYMRKAIKKTFSKKI